MTYLVGLTAYGAVNGSRLTASYAVIVAVAFVGLAVADERFRFSLIVLVGLTLWGLGHLAGGIVELDEGERILYNVVYARWFHVDNIVHFIGFGISGLACWEALRARWLGATEVGSVATVAFVALLGCGVGAVNEVVEFGFTLAFEDTQVGGYQNTGRDLVANLLGGIMAGVYEVRRQRRSVSGNAEASAGD
ncbi:MAG TPA: hypothetical protein VM942_11545 [Acidimicrobiales bacterium]|nr:hypothetical protein [Acidimicrobiales bacterium]